MRRVRYGVGMSLDGCIAGPDGELDYLVFERAHDMRPFFARVDTVLMGRLTYEAALRHGAKGFPGMRPYVFSRTLDPAAHPGVRVVADDVAEVVRALRAEPVDRDIWLAGGGVLLRTLLEAGLVDTVEVGISPVLLGSAGVPIIAPAPPLPAPARLALTGSRTYPSGLVTLEYDVRAAGAA